MLARLWARLRASKRLVLGVVLLAAGLPVALSALAVVVHQLVEDRRFAAEGVTVQGRVLGKEIRRHSRRRPDQYLVTYRFATAPGVEVTGTAKVAPTVWGRLREGGPIAVAYLPRTPSWQRVGGEREGLGFGLAFLLMGVVVAGIGGAHLAALRRAGPGPPARLWKPGTATLMGA